MGATDAVVDRHMKDGKAFFDFSAGRLSSLHVLKGALRLPVHLQQIPPSLRLDALRDNLWGVVLSSLLCGHFHWTFDHVTPLLLGSYDPKTIIALNVLLDNSETLGEILVMFVIRE